MQMSQVLLVPDAYQVLLVPGAAAAATSSGGHVYKTRGWLWRVARSCVLVNVGGYVF